MSDRINLIIPPSSDACIPYTCGALQIEPHNDSPISGQEKLNLVYSDVIGLFPLAINRARYVISFLDDDTKELEVFLK